MELESDAEVEADGNEEDAEAEEARKKAEAEKIQIMEELWQARFSYHGMGFCNCLVFHYK